MVAPASLRSVPRRSRQPFSSLLTDIRVPSTEGGDFMRRHTVSYRLLALVAVVMASLALPTAARAQAVYGSIAGTIEDSTGAALPGVNDTITSVDRKTTDTVVTNGSGNYAKDRLLPGTYSVKAELSGFRPAVVSAAKVNVDTQTKIDLKLDVGQMTEAVEVTATQGQLLKTDRADVATVFEAREITDLPVIDRNFT